jgi:hypothetical protein
VTYLPDSGAPIDAQEDGLMQFTKTAEVDAPAEKVWRVFAHEFDQAHVWMASVQHSAARDVGRQFEGAQSCGRVCELAPMANGVKASEQFLAYDEADKTLTLRIDFLNTFTAFPILHNEVDVSVVDVGSGRSVMTWAFRSRIKPWAVLAWPVLRIVLSVFVGQIIGELQYFVENDRPHPRKVKAMAQAPAGA